jgi:hypothetical protein
MKPRASKGILAGALIALVATVAAEGAVGDAATGPVAVASKKKCKKALWKCAPKRYHLTVSGHYYSEVFSGEVDLEKNRSNFARVEYSQKGGKLTMSDSYTGCCPIEFDMCGDGRWDVQQQTATVPRNGLFGHFDFALFFAKDLENGKWSYSVLGGNPYSELNVPGTVTCTSGASAGATAPFTYYFKGPLGVGNERRGKPGANLSGSDTYGSNNSLKWSLTRK